MVHKDVVDGLPSHDQRSNNVIDPDQILLGCSDARSGFLPLGQIIRVSSGCGVVGMFFLTGFLFRTACTHIRRLVQQFAVAGNVPITQLCAVGFGAELAACKTAVSRMLRTDRVFKTGEEVNTVVVRVVVELAGKHPVLVYLSGYG